MQNLFYLIVTSLPPPELQMLMIELTSWSDVFLVPENKPVRMWAAHTLPLHKTLPHVVVSIVTVIHRAAPSVSAEKILYLTNCSSALFCIFMFHRWIVCFSASSVVINNRNVRTVAPDNMITLLHFLLHSQINASSCHTHGYFTAQTGSVSQHIPATFRSYHHEHAFLKYVSVSPSH